MTDGTGKRFNEGKNRLELIPPFVTEQMGKVLSYGAAKYQDPSNWRRGMPWTTVIASLKRHLNAIEAGSDFDEESKLLHASHLLTNSAFLVEYYNSYKQGDDRMNRFFNKRVGLDLDGVCFRWSEEYCKRTGIETRNANWHFTYKYRRNDDFLKEEDFWLSIKPFEDALNMPFEPVLYATNRDCPIEWCERSIEKYGLECAPVYKTKGSKVDILKDNGVEIFVEDNYKNFVEINNSGILCYLMTRSYNEKFDAGHLRIHSLSEIVKRK